MAPATVPQITVLGVHEWLPDGEELYGDLVNIYFGGNAFMDLARSTADYLERLVPIALFDVLIENADERFDVAHFLPTILNRPDDEQVAYDEALLLIEGDQVLARTIGCANGLRFGRLAFYVYYLDPAKPVSWTYGEFTAPAPQPMSSELAALLPYNRI